MDATTNEYKKAPENLKLDDKVVKKLVGETIAQVDGVLGVKGGIADLLKDDSNPTKGVTVSVSDEQSVDVSAKIVVEDGKNIPQITDQITDEVTRVLQSNAGLRVKGVCVEVADVMTRAEYEEQNAKGDSYPTGSSNPRMPITM